MNLLQICLYLVLAFILYLIINYCTKFEDKIPSCRIIIPVIYIVLVSGLSMIEKDNVYIIILFEMLIRIFYQKIILNQTDQLDTKLYIQNYGLTIILSYIITKAFIIRVDSIYPTPEELRIGIWFLIIYFLYKMFNGSIKISLETEEKQMKLTSEMIVTRYAKFKNQYFQVVKGKTKQLNYLLYANMIWESYNRSSFLRKLDRIKYRFTGRVMKMGIMQLETAREITDEESIKMALKELTTIEKEVSSNKKIKKTSQTKEIIKEYAKEETKANEIANIYETILNFDQK